MIVNAVFRPLVTHTHTHVYSYRNKVCDLVKTALKKNKRISVITSQKNIVNGSKCNKSISYENYAVYDTQINNMFDELTNEIVSDIESCAYDYPETYISLVTTDSNDKISKKSESYLIHSPD